MRPEIKANNRLTSAKLFAVSPQEMWCLHKLHVQSSSTDQAKRAKVDRERQRKLRLLKQTWPGANQTFNTLAERCTQLSHGPFKILLTSYQRVIEH